MRPLIPLTIVAALISGCSREASPTAAVETATANATSAAMPQVSASASASATATATANGGASKIEQEDDVLEFSYAHPAEVGAIPALRARLEGERDAAQRKAHAAAAADRNSARKEGFPFHKHSLNLTWKVVTSTARFLSLSEELYFFTGGAHGNLGFKGLIWDKQAGREVPVLDMFTSKAALKSAVLKPFCAGLEAARRAKGIVRPPEGDSVFPNCVDPVSQATVILGSSNRRAFDRIGFLMDPYVAGSFAEGSYEVTLPVTSAVLAAVRPAYRDAFALR
ncbi:DUF4163 domain-containing protein [Novosphingobium tardum]|uniref:DUF4163 domain-containing protein n=1 Tax=Novosphingobium tardum TaxID=1538021 RepID=A0ABV8RMI1_9SPHN